jgi:hypothetical protein
VENYVRQFPTVICTPSHKFTITCQTKWLTAYSQSVPGLYNAQIESLTLMFTDMPFVYASRCLHITWEPIHWMGVP